MKEKQSAVIMEIRGRYAAALTRDGSFIRIPNNSYVVGETIALQNHTHDTNRRMRFGAVASFVAGFLMLFVGGWKVYITPVGVVSLDVNPSIEYSINIVDRVLDITAVNEDGGAILNAMDEQALLYRPVDDAVDATIVALRENGYLAETTENDVVLSASTGDARHAEALAERLQERVGKQSDLTVYSVPVSSTDVESAHALGTSAGKLHIIEQLKESSGEGEEFDPSDWVKTPVREIIAEMKEHPKLEDMVTATPSISPLPEYTPSPDQLNMGGSNDAERSDATSGATQPNLGGDAGKQNEKPNDEKGGAGGSTGGGSGGRTP